MGGTDGRKEGGRESRRDRVVMGGGRRNGWREGGVEGRRKSGREEQREGGVEGE